MEVRFKSAASLRHLTCLAMEAGGKSLGLRIKAQFAGQDRPMTIRTILIVEDNLEILGDFELAFRKFFGIEIVKVVPAWGELTEKVLGAVENAQADMIFMDGDLGTLRGKDLIIGLRERGFNGYIVANSASPNSSREMLKNGADLECVKKNCFYIKELFEKP